MKIFSVQKHNWVVIAMIAFAVLSRVIFTETGLFNLAPVIAISLFGGALLKNSKPLAYLVPLAAYFLSDLYMQWAHGTGFYGISQFFVYGGMLAIVALGGRMKRINGVSILGYSIGGSLLFWLISNLGVYAAGYYGYGPQGFIETYAAALPFYKNEYSTQLFFNPIIGNAICSLAMFGAYYWVKPRLLGKMPIAG